MGQGMIQGGWGYVIAVYGISWGVMLGYAALLLFQARDRALARALPDESSSNRSSNPSSSLKGRAP